MLAVMFCKEGHDSLLPSSVDVIVARSTKLGGVLVLFRITKQKLRSFTSICHQLQPKRVFVNSVLAIVSTVRRPGLRVVMTKSNYLSQVKRYLESVC